MGLRLAEGRKNRIKIDKGKDKSAIKNKNITGDPCLISKEKGRLTNKS